SMCQDWWQVQEQAQEVMKLATAQEFPYWLAYATALRGRALAARGHVEEGIAQMQQGLASLQTAGAELGRLDHLSWLGAAYAQSGRVEEGLAMLAEALTLGEKTGRRSGEAELYRLKGQLTLQSKVQSPKSKVPNS